MTAVFINSNKGSILRFDSWSDFKKYIDGTYSSLMYFWSLKSESNQYVISTELQGGHYLEILLQIDGGADQLDFENNFKNNPPRNPGSNSQASSKPVAIKQLYDIQELVIYIGSAKTNSLASESVWLIQKITLDAGGLPISTLWSSDIAIWDDRASTLYN